MLCELASWPFLTVHLHGQSPSFAAPGTPFYWSIRPETQPYGAQMQPRRNRQYAANEFRKCHGAGRVEELQGPAAGKNVQRPWAFAKQPDGPRPHSARGKDKLDSQGHGALGHPEGACVCQIHHPSSGRQVVLLS